MREEERINDTLSRLPVTQNDFEAYIVETKGRILSMSDEIVDTIRSLTGRDKVNCWLRAVEVMGKLSNNIQSRASDAERDRKYIKNMFQDVQEVEEDEVTEE
jgi:hypothetical protein